MRQGEICRDTEEPGAGLLVLADGGEMALGAQEDFLREIVGGLLFAGHAPEIVEHLAFEAAHKGLELVRLACAYVRCLWLHAFNAR
jgi:hypothetical protein